MEEVLFFQFFEKMKPFREKFVMIKFEEYEISFLFVQFKWNFEAREQFYM